MNTNKKVFIVLPSYLESKVIGKVIRDIKKEGFKNIIVVDDGSKDDTYKIARSENVYVTKHLINRGKGAATQTGLDISRELGADITVTMDSDGQHNPKYIKSLIKPILEDKADVTIGARLENREDMPLSRRVMNVIANVITWIFFGVYVRDSQSGFRAYSKKSLEKVYTYMDRYEFESEMLGAIKGANLKLVEVPIEVIYTEHSKNKYKNNPKTISQGLINGISMFVRLLENSIFK